MDKSKKVGLSSARDLFNNILPYLKSSSEVYRQTAAMVGSISPSFFLSPLALERSNNAVYETLFEAMKPYCAEYSKKANRSLGSGRSVRKEKVRLRNIISCKR